MDLKLLERLDELYTENPMRGTRRMSKALRKRFGFEAGRDKVRRLMQIMGVAAIYRVNHCLPSEEELVSFKSIAQEISLPASGC
ncbi:MAG: transposase [Nitrospirae bacterium]|nr:transposase [Candidatus Troglogloeales bacterium]